MVKLSMLIAFVLAFAVYSQGQTADPNNSSPPQTVTGSVQQLWDATLGSTNLALATGYARGTKGDKNVFFAEYMCNVSQNVGVVLGGDRAWTDMAGVPSEAYILRGGLALKTDILPLKNWGITNVVITPFAEDLVGTPVSGTSNNGGLANIAATGVDTRWRLGTKENSGKVHVGVFYENRTGQGYFIGNYFGGYFAILQSALDYDFDNL